MHFPLQHPCTPGTRLGSGIRRGGCGQGGRTVEGTIASAVQSQWLRHALGKKPGERLLVVRFHNISQEDKTQVTVERLRPRRIRYRLLENFLDSLLTTGWSAASV